MSDRPIRINVRSTAKRDESYELPPETSRVLEGLSLLDTIDGGILQVQELTGRTFVIRGAQDRRGRPHAPFQRGLKRVLLVRGPFNHRAPRGVRLRRYLSGRTIGPDVTNLNLVEC